MELTEFFQSIIEQDPCEIVICNTEHTIIYMNSAARRRYGNRSLVGKSILDCHNERSAKRILEIVRWFSLDKEHNRVHTFYNEKEEKDVYMVALRQEQKELIGYYEKHEYRKRDRSPLYLMED